MAKAVRLDRIVRSAQATHRTLVFRRAMRRFLRDPEACASPGNSVLNALVYGWGNENWSAHSAYLAACVGGALAARGAILECGSGLSTLLIGTIAQRRGTQHWALEHAEGWATKVQRSLHAYGIGAVNLCRAPLRDFGEFSWYDAPVAAMPERMALVICDGPPGDTKGGRYGMVPKMAARLAAGCVILLDDAHRQEEMTIARRWASELPATTERCGPAEGYFKLTVGATAGA